MLMMSSGMGNAEIRHLTYQDFLDALKDYNKPAEDDLFDR